MNYYDILGVGRNATQDEIRKAYRTLAMQWHPDRWIGGTKEEQTQAEEVFKAISEVYSVLGNPTSREEYDYALTMSEYRREEPSRSYAAADAEPQVEENGSSIWYWVLFMFCNGLVAETLGQDMPILVYLLFVLLYFAGFVLIWKLVRRFFRVVRRKFR